MIDCGKSLSHLEVRPTSILLVCSDGTAGLQDLTWSHWGHNVTTGGPGQTVPSATAKGTGEFVLNTCDPNCAEGHHVTYPVQVTLSVVYSSPYGGTYFGQASLTWLGKRPPAGTKSTYLLPDPVGLWHRTRGCVIPVSDRFHSGRAAARPVLALRAGKPTA